MDEIEVTVTRYNVTALIGWAGIAIGLVAAALQYFNPSMPGFALLYRRRNHRYRHPRRPIAHGVCAASTRQEVVMMVGHHSSRTRIPFFIL